MMTYFWNTGAQERVYSLNLYSMAIAVEQLTTYLVGTIHVLLVVT